MELILVTGGAGFIGSHLVNSLLEQGYKVRILDNLSAQVHGEVPTGLDWLSEQNIEFIRGSVSNRAELGKALIDVDYIVHLAAETGTGQSMYEVAKYNNVNTFGTAMLLDILANDASHKVKRIILASSRSVYGEGAYICQSCNSDSRVFPQAREQQQLANHLWEPLCETCETSLSMLPTKESDPIFPASIYASTKYAQEDLIRIACTTLGIGFGILRFQNVYGERQSLKNPYTGILSIFSTRVRRGLELPIFEDGNETRDFVHVEDVAQVVTKCISMKKSPNQIINVGSGKATTVFQVAQSLTLALGEQPNLRVTAEYRIGDIRHNCADITKLEQILGYVPQISLDEGMSRFAKWVLTQPLPEDLLEKANEELKERKMMG